MTLSYLACELSNVGAIPLGRTGEHNATRVIIDATEWQAEYPNGALVLLVRNPDGAVYPAEISTDGYRLVWTVTRDDLSIAGSGEIELNLIADGYVGKSARCATQIDAALTQNTDNPPESTPEWVTELLNLLSSVDSEQVEAILAQYQEMKDATEEAQSASAAASSAAETAATAAQNATSSAADAQAGAEAANEAAAKWNSEPVADANKLGGRAPAYYLQKRNLLDNSDFLVAQAGYNALHDDHFYCADRWRASQGGGVVTITKNNGYIKLTTTAGYSYIFQAVEVSSLTQDEYTFTFTRRGGLSSRMLIYGVPTQGEIVQIKSQWLAGVSDWTTDVIHLMRTEFAAYETVWFAIRNEDAGSMDYKEVAVYSGLHTADNLPHYVPRGYGAELAECRRYFRKTFEADHPAGDNGYLLVRGATKNWLTNIEFGTPMRCTPTVKVYSPLSGAEKTISDFNADVDVETSATVVMTNKDGFKVYCQGALDPGKSYYFHYTANADL